MLVGGTYADRDWYKALTRVPTAIIQLEENALVGAGMSLMWVPRDPRVAPICAYKVKGYRLMYILDPEVGGEMTARLLPEGEKPWVEQIRNNFLHHSSENLNTYVATPLGSHLPVSVKSEVGKPPIREEAILLSSEEYTGSSPELIHRFTRAGPRARAV
ncbi:hypothetical protein HanOQP8_Chr17g0641741 [Helianthus annuus]|nr:hypothetical protein HanLR1_Chr17g0646491 [Helianthus annuus]KAJ0634590.1 hypothetical protein HanOQP8_Chr17g0641741 [Helianthus annuus]